MCSITLTRPDIHVATEDIICYKYITKVLIKSYLFGLIKKYKIVSKYKNFKYERNVVYKTKLSPFEQNLLEYCYESSSGFYSYKDKQSNFNKKDCVKCIIPKGSKYYLTNEDELFDFTGPLVYISNQIKIIS